MRALPLSSSNKYCCPPSLGVYQNVGSRLPCKAFNTVGVWAKLDDDEKGNKEEAKKTKQSLFGSVTEALDFSQVRSPKDAQLLEGAREATKSGGKMSREQVKPLFNSGTRLEILPNRVRSGLSDGFYNYKYDLICSWREMQSSTYTFTQMEQCCVEAAICQISM